MRSSARAKPPRASRRISSTIASLNSSAIESTRVSIFIGSSAGLEFSGGLRNIGARGLRRAAQRRPDLAIAKTCEVTQVKRLALPGGQRRNALAQCDCRVRVVLTNGAVEFAVAFLGRR